MPRAVKRKQPKCVELEAINKKLKLLEDMIKNTSRRSRSPRRRSPSARRRPPRADPRPRRHPSAGRRPRPRRPVIESSSDETSREPSPSPSKSSAGGHANCRNEHHRDITPTTVVEVHAAAPAVASAETQDTLLSEILDAGAAFAAAAAPPGSAPAPPPPDAPGTTAAQSSNETDPTDDALDSIVLELLGDDPTATTEYGKEIHKELASRFEHIATVGLAKEVRKELFGKYQIPSNCARTGAPQLNAEIKAALPENLQKRDKAIEARQKQLASAISCLAEITSEQLTCKDKNHDLIKKLMDAGRLLCDIQYAESTTRRNFAMFAVKRDMKEHLQYTKIDKYLFGENFSDALKTAKAVCKSGTDLKIDNKTAKKPRAAAPSTTNKVLTTKALNWKTPAPTRRPTGPQRSREPASRRSPPATSSRPSSYPQRPTRRR